MKIPAIIGLGTAVLIGAIVFFVSVSRDDDGAVKLGSKTAAASCTEAAPDCLPTVDFVDHEGQVYSATDMLGKVVVVNVWATWCKPCRAEMPELVKLRDEFPEKDLMLLGVLNDTAAQPKVESFLERYGVNYPTIPLTDEIDNALDFPNKLPTTFIYGRDGRLLLRKIGGVTAEELSETIASAI